MSHGESLCNFIPARPPPVFFSMLKKLMSPSTQAVLRWEKQTEESQRKVDVEGRSLDTPPTPAEGPEVPRAKVQVVQARVQDSILPLQTVLRARAQRETQCSESRLKESL